MAHTNGMETFWSMLKRGYVGAVGAYHNISPKHLGRYVAEFSGRHNIQQSDTLAQMGSLVKGMAGKRLRYAMLIVDNGLSSGARALWLHVSIPTETHTRNTVVGFEVRGDLFSCSGLGDVEWQQGCCPVSAQIWECLAGDALKQILLKGSNGS